MQALAVACGEDKLAFRRVAAGLAIRLRNLSHAGPVQALAVACAIRGGEGLWSGGAKG